MKHTLLNKTVFKGGKLLKPGDTVDATKEELIEWGELDAEGNAFKTAAVQSAAPSLTALPEGVKPAIVAVPGVGDKLADKVIEAINTYLAAPTPPESGPEPEQE